MRPWIHVGERLRGSGGCNEFHGQEGAYRIGDGLMVPGGVLFTASACVAPDGSDAVMAAERMMQAFLRESGDLGFELWADDHRMRWHADGVTMFFFKVDREPLPGGIWVNPAED